MILKHLLLSFIFWQKNIPKYCITLSGNNLFLSPPLLQLNDTILDFPNLIQEICWEFKKFQGKNTSSDVERLQPPYCTALCPLTWLGV